MSLYRLNRAHEDNDRIEIVRFYPRIPVVWHWSSQFRAIWSNSLSDRVLDVVLAPFADTVLRIRGNVAADTWRDLTETREFAPARIGEAHIEWLAVPRRCVAQHAMSEAHEITAISDFISGYRLIDVCDRRTVARQCDFVL